MFNFDEIIDRRDTLSIKYDYAARRGRPADVFPMWVADMDFRAPPCVAETLSERVAHGIYGYSDTDAAYDRAVSDWFLRRHGWEVSPEWNCVTPGVVPALHLAVRAFTGPGDGVLIQPPVYYPFSEAVGSQGRRLVTNELVLNGGKYEIDFADFEEKAKSAELFILCSPANPAGRVWTRDELTRLGEICLKYGLVVISDEIHADFVYSGSRHSVFAGLSEKFADITVTCTSPSKTFNLAGLMHANIFIKNPALRRAFRREYSAAGLSQGSVMGIAACRAVYERGEPWLAELLAYLGGNLRLAADCFADGKLRLVRPEGTYLLWLDCRALGLPPAELDRKILGGLKLWLDDGAMFGSGGEGFTRLNMALPRSRLADALSRFSALKN
ncbi:MAG: pyridoxal phosphate-dependent aminotransferase [Oscillospiraceae bacterium]|nr:pyridoxal phosphate-dependent aminotransferase [Oscillospiraceae bacterium]